MIAEAKSLRPRNAAELADILREANDARIPVQTSKHRDDGGIRLDMAAMNQVVSYDPGDLTLRVEAGARIGEVLALLGQHQQFLPLDFGDDHGTIGGALGTAESGPLAAGYGLLRDFCIGLEFVTADGLIAHSGGMVVKNVAGYDLMKLLIGSRGTLAIVTSASFKTFPKPSQTATFVSLFEGYEPALAFALRVRRSPLTPIRLELVHPHQGRWSVMVTANGPLQVLERYRKELAHLAPGIEEVDGQQEADLWAQVGAPQPCSTVEVWSTLAELRPLLGTFTTGFPGKLTVRGRVGIGHLLLSIEGEPERLTERLAQIPELQYEWRNPRLPMSLHKDPAARRVKQALDPHGILNPGAIRL